MLPSPFGVYFEEPKDEQPKEPFPSPRGVFILFIVKETDYLTIGEYKKKLPSPCGVCFEEPKDEQPKEPFPSPRGDYVDITTNKDGIMTVSVPSWGLL